MGSNTSSTVGDGYYPGMENYELSAFKKLPSGTFYHGANKTWYGPSSSLRYHQTVSVGEVLLACCNRTPEKLAQISDDSGKRLTYRDLKLASVRICENLKTLGYQKGDMVMVIARNGHTLAPVIFGCLLLGAPVNTMDPTFGKDDLSHMMAISRPKLVFCDTNCVDVARESLVAVNLTAEIVTVEQKLPGIRCADELMSKPVEDEENYSPMPSHAPAYKTPAIIFCSSGTTGKSKAVVISQALLLAKCNELVNINQSDVTLCFSSVYWLSGLMWMLFSAFNNTTRVTTTESFSADLMLRLIDKYKITTIMTPPSQLSTLVHYPGLASVDLSSLKTYLCGGSMVSTMLVDRIQPHMPNCKIIVGYGMTEVSGVVAINYPKAKAGSVGRLMGQVEAKTVNENGAQVGPGETGEILIRTLYYFMSYLNNETATRETIDSQQWIHTGDTGHFDAEGYLFLEGRKKEIIKYCNYQISPSDIVEKLEKIVGVETAFVTGIADIDKGDLPTALCVRATGATATEEEVLTEYNSKSPDYKHLRGGLFFVQELPMTISGKIAIKEAKVLATKLYNDRRGVVTIISNSGNEE